MTGFLVVWFFMSIGIAPVLTLAALRQHRGGQNGAIMIACVLMLVVVSPVVIAYVVAKETMMEWRGLRDD